MVAAADDRNLPGRGRHIRFIQVYAIRGDYDTSAALNFSARAHQRRRQGRLLLPQRRARVPSGLATRQAEQLGCRVSSVEADRKGGEMKDEILAEAARSAEPVAWLIDRPGCRGYFVLKSILREEDRENAAPLYLHPSVNEAARSAEPVAEAQLSLARDKVNEVKCALYNRIRSEAAFEKFGYMAESAVEILNSLLDAPLHPSDSAIRNAAIPDGYCVVPKEPTAEMTEAAWAVMRKHGAATNEMYRQMLAAAPEVPK